MKNLIKITPLFLIIVILNSCKTSFNEKIPVKNSEPQKIDKVDIEKSSMEIRVSCGEGGISEYLNNGWVIVEQYSEEKICTWKTTPATKDCDMEKDKGCKITAPDKIGEEKVYLIEK